MPIWENTVIPFPRSHAELNGGPEVLKKPGKLAWRILPLANVCVFDLLYDALMGDPSWVREIIQYWPC